MSNEVIVHKGRTNVITVDMGEDLTGITVTSEIRSEPEQSSTLIATWTVTFLTTAAAGILKLTLDNTITSTITATRGYMDLKKMVAGEPMAVFDRPLEVSFRGTVTA